MIYNFSVLHSFSSEEIATNWEEICTTFDAMDLKEDLLRGIYAYGFEKPSAIQQVCCAFLLKKHNRSLFSYPNFKNSHRER